MNQTLQHEILCPIDLEHESLSTENVAYAMAQKLGCKLRLLYVDKSLEQTKFYQSYTSHTVLPVVWEKLGAQILADHARALRHRIHTMGVQTPTDVTFDVIAGSPAKEILKYIKQSHQSFSMIVLGKRKRSFFNEFLLGSVANEVVARATLPTLLVPDSGHQFLNWNLKQFTVASGLQAGSIDVAKFALQLANAFHAKLKLVHVLAVRSSYGSSAFAELNPAEADNLDLFFATAEGQVQRELDAQSSALRLASDRASTEVLYGKATEQLLNEMKFHENDILVVGKHNGVDEAKDELGSVASSLARTSRFPLLIVPHVAKNAKRVA